MLLVAARDANQLQDDLLAADRDVLKLGTRVKVLDSQLAAYNEAKGYIRHALSTTTGMTSCQSPPM